MKGRKALQIPTWRFERRRVNVGGVVCKFGSLRLSVADGQKENVFKGTFSSTDTTSPQPASCAENPCVRYFTQEAHVTRGDPWRYRGDPWRYRGGLGFSSERDRNPGAAVLRSANGRSHR